MFIHRHELIAHSKYKQLKGHENEKELFLTGDKLTLAIIKDIIEKNIKMFDYYNPQLEVDKLKIQDKIWEKICEELDWEFIHTI